MNHTHTNTQSYKAPTTPQYTLQARFKIDSNTTICGNVLGFNALSPITASRPQDLISALHFYSQKPFVLVAWKERLDGEEFRTLFAVPQSRILAFNIAWPTDKSREIPLSKYLE